MKVLEYSVSRASVMELVHKLTAYEGSKVPPLVAKDGSMVDADRYKDVHTVRANEEVLDEYWRTARDEIVRVLRNYDGEVAGGEDALSARLLLSDNYDEHLFPAVEEATKQAIGNQVTAEWLSMSLPNRAEAFAAKARAEAEKIDALLCSRLRPQKRGV